MIRYQADQLICDYDAFTDVLYVTFRRVAASIGNETPAGFIVRRARPSGEVVGVTILDYVERFGPGARDLEIDSSPPFAVALDPVDCRQAAMG